ncbi:transcriptional regulator, Fur family [Campylobacter corcagiensis]|nr:transcriptional regulator, Fur family [Campylobacter corcagiensis]
MHEIIFQNILDLLLKSKSFTPKEGVLKILFYNKHLSIKEIRKIYRDIYKKSVSVSTIYQTLNLLQSYGLLKTIQYSNFSKYEIDIYPDHDHLVCTKCGKIVEFRDDSFNELRKKVEKEYFFDVEGYILLLEGICEKCKK